MLMPIPAMVDAPQNTAPKATISEALASAQAIAAFELAWWRKNHPTADISLTFSDPAITTAQSTLVRNRLGYKNPIAVLNAHVLTLILDTAERVAPKRVGVDGYVFLGSFPKGFRARYLVSMVGRTPRVLTRTVLQTYEIVPPAEKPVASPKT